MVLLQIPWLDLGERTPETEKGQQKEGKKREGRGRKASEVGEGKGTKLHVVFTLLALTVIQ